jgi:hypothetical protein
MLYIFTGQHSYIGWIVTSLSIGMLVLAGWLIRAHSAKPDLLHWDFSLALVTTVAVSHYCFDHDLSILFLAIALTITKLQSQSGIRLYARALIVCASVVLFFSPLQLFLVGRYQLGMMGWAVLLLFAGIVFQTWPVAANSATAETVHVRVSRPIRG